MKTILAAAAVAALALHAHAQLVINEVRIDDEAADNFEYVELFNAGATDVTLSTLTYLVIGDGSQGDSGVIEDVIALPGISVPAGGYHVISNQGVLRFDNDSDGTIDIAASPNQMSTLQFENGDNVTHLVVSGFSGADNADLDTNDDGTLDVTPWSSVVDAIGLVEVQPPVGTNDEWVYGAALGFQDIGPSGNSVPAHVYRSPDGGAWNIGTFGTEVETGPGTGIFYLVGTRDTPTVTNPTVVPLTLSLDLATVAESAGFSAVVGTVSRPGTSGNLEVTITGDDPTEAVPIVATVTILDGTSSATFDIDAVDDLFPDGTQTVTFGVSAPATLPDTATLDVTDDPGDSFSVVINELYPRPDAVSGDANGDGVVGSNSDEFIEIINVTAAPIDLTGFRLTDAVRDIHFFTDGTVLQPGCALVVFGGGDFFPGTVAGAFGNAEVQRSSEGLIFLTDSGDTVSIVDAGNAVRHDVTTPDVSADPELGSYNLNTDADATSGYDRHTVIAANPANQFSPGTTVAGAAFCPAPTQGLTLSVTPGSIGEDAGPGAATATVSIPSPLATDLLVLLETGDDSEAVPQFPGAFIFAGMTSADIPLDAVNDSQVDGTQTVTLSASASGYTNGTTTVDVTDDGDAPAFTDLVINEVDADQPGTDTTEYIELFNLSGNAESLDGLVLVLFNGSDDASYNAFDLTGQTIPANGYLVVGNAPGAFTPANFPATNAIQNGPDAVAIYVGGVADFPNDTPPGSVSNILVDAMVYGTDDGDDPELIAAFGGPQYDEGPDNNSNSNSRVPDGTGAFVAQAPTPGAANVEVVPASPQILTITPDFGGGTVNMSIANVSPGTTYSLNSTSDLTETIPFAQLLTFDPGVDGFEDAVGSGIYVFDFLDASISGKPKNFYQVSSP